MDEQHRPDAAQAIGLLRGDWAIFFLLSGPETQRPVTDTKLAERMRFSASLVEFLPFVLFWHKVTAGQHLYDPAGITVRTAKDAVTRPDFTCCDWLNH